MDIEAEGVSQAMAKAGAITRLLDDRTGRPVHLNTRPARGKCVDARLLGLQDDFIDLPHLLRGVAHGKGTGHV